jgi:hypothetical protein
MRAANTRHWWADEHCYVFWPNFLKCDPLLVLSVFSQGVAFQEIRPKKRAMLTSGADKCVQSRNIRVAL